MLVLLAKKGLTINTDEYMDLAYIENGEYKLLSDSTNTKHNAKKNASLFKKLFKLSKKKNSSSTSKKDKADNSDKTS